MNKKLRIAVKSYLRYCEQNGIRRVYECFVPWMKQEEPRLYAELNVFKQLAKLPHKNDLAYRAFSSADKETVRKERTRLYGRLAELVYKPTLCVTCGKEVALRGSSNPVSLKEALVKNEFCSVQCVADSDTVKRARQATNLKRYGHVCTLHNKEVAKKKQATWRKNWGVDNPSKAPEVVGRILNNRYGRKAVVLKGVTYEYQGYEAVVLRALSKDSRVKNFTTTPKEVGMFSYKMDGKHHKYLPDVKVRMKKTKKPVYLEIKSRGTLASTPAVAARVLAKAKTMWRLGYTYRVVLCSNKEVMAVAKDYPTLRALVSQHC